MNPPRARTLRAVKRLHPGVAGVHQFPWSHSRRGPIARATADCRMDAFSAPGRPIASGTTRSIGPRHGAYAVLLVEVTSELHHAVRRRPRRQISEIQGYGMLKAHVPALPALLDVLDVLLLPTLVGEHPGGQLLDAMHAHAA